jgi:hypothetical protein
MLMRFVYMADEGNDILRNGIRTRYGYMGHGINATES